MLIVGAAVFGLGNGAMDVAMNALGVSVEQARRRPVMSRLHACFSIGNFVGALLVVVLGWLVADVGAALVAVEQRAAARRAPARRWPASRRSHRRASAAARTAAAARSRAVAWLLAAMAVCFGLTEGTGDRLVVAARRPTSGDVSPSAGAWGLACVSGFMVVIRLFGDAVVERLGRAAVVRFGAVCALVGYLLTAFTSGLAVILVGWCLVGPRRRAGRAADLRAGRAHRRRPRPRASWSASGTPPSSSAPP